MRTLKSTFTLPEYITNELSSLAQELGEKKSHIVAEALMQYFDTIDLKIAKIRSEEVKSGKVKPIAFEDIKAELGL